MRKVLKFVLIIIGVFIAIALLMPDDTSTVTESPSVASTDEITTEQVDEKPDFEIVKHSETYESITDTRTIHVQVKNNSNSLVQYADLKSVYYDKAGNVVGTGLGNVLNIAAGATKTIDVLSMGIVGADNYEIEVGNVMYE